MQCTTAKLGEWGHTADVHLLWQAAHNHSQSYRLMPREPSKKRRAVPHQGLLWLTLTK